MIGWTAIRKALSEWVGSARCARGVFLHGALVIGLLPAQLDSVVTWPAHFAWPEEAPGGGYGSRLQLDEEQLTALESAYGWVDSCGRCECDTAVLGGVTRELCERGQGNLLGGVQLTKGWPDYRVTIFGLGPNGWLQRAIDDAKKRFCRERGFVMEPALAEVDLPLAPAYGLVTADHSMALGRFSDGVWRQMRGDTLPVPDSPSLRLKCILSLAESVVPDSVPRIMAGRFIDKWLPPVHVLVRGRGDCDSKTMLMVAIWERWYQDGDLGCRVFSFPCGDRHHMVFGSPVGPPAASRARYRPPLSSISYVICDPTTTDEPGIIGTGCRNAWDLALDNHWVEEVPLR
jgi:hypothetical protein